MVLLPLNMLYVLGHSLLSRLSESNSQLTVSSTNMKPAAVHVREILDQLAENFSEVQAAGAERTTTLEQCLQLRDYEANVAQVLTSLQLFVLHTV